MLQMEIRSLVYHIVQQELVGKGKDREALHLNFDLRMASYNDGHTYDQSRGLHLLYHCFPHSSYVSVFSGVTASPFGRLREVKEWRHECSHDSCWRDVNIFSHIYFEMAQQINDARKADKREAIAPKDMSEHNSFRDRVYQWVPVSVKKDESDDYNYRRIITLE